jgi:hypothetical protein
MGYSFKKTEAGIAVWKTGPDTGFVMEYNNNFQRDENIAVHGFVTKPDIIYTGFKSLGEMISAARMIRWENGWNLNPSQSMINAFEKFKETLTIRYPNEEDRKARLDKRKQEVYEMIDKQIQEDAKRPKEVINISQSKNTLRKAKPSIDLAIIAEMPEETFFDIHSRKMVTGGR